MVYIVYIPCTCKRISVTGTWSTVRDQVRYTSDNLGSTGWFPRGHFATHLRPRKATRCRPCRLCMPFQIALQSRSLYLNYFFQIDFKRYTWYTQYTLPYTCMSISVLGINASVHPTRQGRQNRSRWPLSDQRVHKPMVKGAPLMYAMYRMYTFLRSLFNLCI